LPSNRATASSSDRSQTWATNPPGRTRYTVANAAQRVPDYRAGYSEVRIVSVEGFRFSPWEVEAMEAE